MQERKIKRFKTFIKDLVFNNPRADRQMPIGNTASQEVLDKKMLYDKKDECVMAGHTQPSSDTHVRVMFFFLNPSLLGSWYCERFFV